MSVHRRGNFAEEMLQRLHVDKLLMGADAIDIEKGISNATLDEVPVKRLAIGAAREVVSVSDSAKFDKISFV